jgi:hypothetical protein
LKKLGIRASKYLFKFSIMVVDAAHGNNILVGRQTSSALLGVVGTAESDDSFFLLTLDKLEIIYNSTISSSICLLVTDKRCQIFDFFLFFYGCQMIVIGD